MSDLDSTAVYAFTLVADHKSFTRAARILNSTQSAVSLKVGRLEKRLGRRLFERTPRMVRLSAAGEAFLPRARALTTAYFDAITAFDEQPARLTLGISHHLVDLDLASLLRRARGDGSLIIDLSLGSTRALLDRYDAGELDAVLLIRYDENRRSGETIVKEEFCWMASRCLKVSKGERLPMIVQAESCKMRAMTVAALASSRIPWREAFLGTGISSLAAAAEAGFGIAVLSRRAAPASLVDVGKHFELPELPSKQIVLHSNVSDHRAQKMLRGLVEALQVAAPLD